ncbi:hypothetical protein JT358_05385 [Micrococcales bacterium 31B]|nr:hypothetical protein [Micrococcales bacterium 31B]
MTISAPPPCSPPAIHPQRGDSLLQVPDGVDPRYYDASLLGDDFFTLSPRERSERFMRHARSIEAGPRQVDLTTESTGPCLHSDGLFRTVDLWFPNNGCFADATAVWIWLGRPRELTPPRHTVVSPQRWRPPQGVIHRETALPPQDLATCGEFLVTSTLRSLCDLLRYSEPDVARGLILRAFHERLGESAVIARELRRFARQKFVARAMQRLIDATAEFQDSTGENSDENSRG